MSTKPVALAQSFTVNASVPSRPPAPGALARDTFDTLDPSAIIMYGDSLDAFQKAGSGTAAATHRGGAILLAVDGSFTYTPPSGGLTGDDFFKYKLTNAAGSSANLVTLSPGSSPVAIDGSFNVIAGGFQVASPGVLAGDTLNGGGITNYGPLGIVQTQIGQPAPTVQGGTVSLKADGSFFYASPSGFSGTDSFNYIIGNGQGAALATVTLNVIVGVTAFNAVVGTPLQAPAPGILANAPLNGGSIVRYGINLLYSGTTVGNRTSTVMNGSVTVNADGSFVYAPPSGFFGYDCFAFELQNAAGSVIAYAQILVADGAAKYLPPVAAPSSFTASTITGVSANPPGLLANCRLNGAAILNYGGSSGTEQTTVGLPAKTNKGSVTIYPDGSFHYTPDVWALGDDSFVFVIANPAGSSSATVSVSIHV